MRIAILGDNSATFVPTLAKSLEKILLRLGVDVELFADSYPFLKGQSPKFRRELSKWYRNRAKDVINIFQRRRLEKIKPVMFSVERFFDKLRSFDAIVVVATIPGAFLPSFFPTIEVIRERCPLTPIVNPSHFYLGTRGPWIDRLQTLPEYEGSFGLERYDWYLSASVVSEYPMPRVSQPCSRIGIDIRDDQLVPKSKTFRVLVDFPQTGFEEYRRIQLDSLRRANISYSVLEGRYSIREIRALYSEHAAMFLSFRESFGLPIVENQLCGNLILTPDAAWAPSHYIKDDIFSTGAGTLGTNFVVYDNDGDKLVEMLSEQKERYCATRNFENFRKEYPHFYSGDLVEAKRFLAMIESGEISSTSHKRYLELNKLIVSKID